MNFKKLAVWVIVILTVVVFLNYPSIKKPYFNDPDGILYTITFEGIDVTDSIDKTELLRLLTELEFSWDWDVSVSARGPYSLPSESPGVFYGYKEGPWVIYGFDDGAFPNKIFRMELGKQNIIYQYRHNFFRYRIKKPEELIAFLEAQAVINKKIITEEEALRRKELEMTIGYLNQLLTTEASELFGGLWLEHTPYFKVVVLLTEGNKKTLSPYLKENLAQLENVIVVRRARYSLAELNAARREIEPILKHLDIDYQSYTDVEKNHIVIEVLDRTPIDNAVKSGKLKIPPSIRIEIITPNDLMKRQSYDIKQ